jgi:hypothetical protein
MAKGNFTFDINKEDWAKLQSAVNGLNKVDGNQAIMNSLAVGMRQLTSKGKSNLMASGNVKKGHLLKSIGNKRMKKWMSVYGGFKRSGPHRGNHAHLIDRGTDKRYTKKGYYRGSVSKGSPNTGSRFWTRAAEMEGPKIMEKTLNVIYKEVDKIIRKKK